MFSASAIGTSANLAKKLKESANAQDAKPTGEESALIDAAAVIVADHMTTLSDNVVKVDVSVGSKDGEISLSLSARAV